MRDESPLESKVFNGVIGPLYLLSFREFFGQAEDSSIHQSFPDSQMREKSIVLGDKSNPRKFTRNQFIVDSMTSRSFSNMTHFLFRALL